MFAWSICNSSAPTEHVLEKQTSGWFHTLKVCVVYFSILDAALTDCLSLCDVVRLNIANSSYLVLPVCARVERYVSITVIWKELCPRS